MGISGGDKLPEKKKSDLQGGRKKMVCTVLRVSAMPLSSLGQTWSESVACCLLMIFLAGDFDRPSYWCGR